MRNNSLTIILVFLILGIIGQLFFRFHTSILNSLTLTIDSLEIKQGQLDRIIIDQLTINGRIIDNWDLLDIYGEKKQISDLLLLKNCVFFLFTEYSCGECIKSSLEHVYSKLDGKYDLIIICGYNNFLEALNRLKEFNLDCNAYVFQRYNDCIFSINSNYPYLFKVSSNLEILSNYPIKDNFDYLNDFFNE